jgi:hypothetical protein
MEKYAMLKVNVGLSRKLSRDYNSTGFSINMEGDVCVGLDDPEAVVEKVKELYDLADEALSQQIERYQGDSAIASRDEDRQSNSGSSNGRQTQSRADGNGRSTRHDRPQSEEQNGRSESATNKQVQYLLNLGKRQGLTPQQLEHRIENTFGRSIGVYQLTKQEAGQLIDSLNQGSHGNGNGNGRSHG